MRIREFVDTYCADLKSLFENTASILDEEYDLPFEDEIEDDAGNTMKVVYAGTTPIPILDIITSDRSDFVKLYPTFEARELYDSYIGALTLLEGEEAVYHIRNAMRMEQERISIFKNKNSLAGQLC
ncbi:MAG: hypothetical protein NC131_15590 [Roseburia sp.]|nr:hypothetical protein [Roseburia sp.]